jgi:hypothetical protein
MNESIINGLFALAGTLMGGIVSYFISRNAMEMNTLKSQVNRLAKQVVSYWNLEKLYVEEISKLISKPAKTVLQDFRERIELMDFERPTMTEKEAKKILYKNS